MREYFRMLSICACVVICPAVAAAQAAPDWASKIETRKALFVITTDGEQIEGKAAARSRDGVVIETSSGMRAVRYDQVFRAQRRDSSWSGLGYGAAIGAGWGVISWKTTDCRDEFLKGLCEGLASMAPMLGAAAGALIGWTIDLVHPGRRTIFEAEPARRLSLVAGPGRAALTVAW